MRRSNTSSFPALAASFINRSHNVFSSSIDFVSQVELLGINNDKALTLSKSISLSENAGATS